MKKNRNQKLNETSARLLVRDLDDKALAAATGGGGGDTITSAGCRACGILATTGI